MDDIVNALKVALNKPLPGEKAQNIMSPTVRFTGQIPHNKDEARKSSVFLILFQNSNGEWVIPFIKRPVYNGVHSGQVSLPGGKCEEIDSSFLETAFRETEEEIGVYRNELEFVGALSSIYIPNSNFIVYPQVGVLQEIPMFMPDKREVEAILEVRLVDLLSTKKHEVFVRTVNGIEVHAPFFDASGQRIWGATAMMLSEFVEIIRANAQLLSPLLHSCNDCNVPEC